MASLTACYSTKTSSQNNVRTKHGAEAAHQHRLPSNPVREASHKDISTFPSGLEEQQPCPNQSRQQQLMPASQSHRQRHYIPPPQTHIRTRSQTLKQQLEKEKLNDEISTYRRHIESLMVGVGKRKPVSEANAQREDRGRWTKYEYAAGLNQRGQGERSRPEISPGMDSRCDQRVRSP